MFTFGGYVDAMQIPDWLSSFPCSIEFVKCKGLNSPKNFTIISTSKVNINYPQNLRVTKNARPQQEKTDKN